MVRILFGMALGLILSLIFQDLLQEYEGADLDGLSILPTLLGEPGRQQPREFLYWEARDEQALRLDDWYVHRSHPDSPVEIYDAIRDPGQTADLAPSKPELVARAETIFAQEHAPNLYFPAPGQSREDWEAELRRRGIDLPNNVDV